MFEAGISDGACFLLWVIIKIMRINQFLARAGVSSRRGAEDFITRGLVVVNNKVVRDLSLKIDPSKDEVKIEGKKISVSNELVYLMLNKPIGYTSTVFDTHAEKSVMSLVPKIPGLVPIGRLDRDSEGALLFSNDGDFVYKLSHPRFDVAKVYEVKVQGKLSLTIEKDFSEGIPLKEGVACADVKILKQYPDDLSLIEMTLHQGLNRQIRRMCGVVGLRVISLKRVSVGPYALGPLRIGKTKEIPAKALNR